MYYNDGDRQNSLSLIAVLITRLNTKASISYSLTRHRSHPEPRGAPLRCSRAGRCADKTHQFKLSSCLCMQRPRSLLTAWKENNTPGRPHAPTLCHCPGTTHKAGGNQAGALILLVLLWAHDSITKKMYTCPHPIPCGQVKTWGYRKAAPMPQHPAWCQHSKSRCLCTGCTRQEENTCFPACKQTHPNPPELIIVKPNCTHIPQHKLPGGATQQGFCPGDATCTYSPLPAR